MRRSLPQLALLAFMVISLLPSQTLQAADLPIFIKMIKNVPTINGISLNRDSGRLYSAEGQNYVVIDTISDTPLYSVRLRDGVTANSDIALNRIANTLYIPVYDRVARQIYIEVYNLFNDAWIASIPLTGVPVATNSSTNRVYAGAGEVGSSSFGVSAIDGSTNAVVSTIPMNYPPYEPMVVDEINNLVYFITGDGQDLALFILDGFTNTISKTIPFKGEQGYGTGIALDSDNMNRLYVTTTSVSTSSNIYTIDTANYSIISVAPVDKGIAGVAFNPITRNLFYSWGDVYSPMSGIVAYNVDTQTKVDIATFSVYVGVSGLGDVEINPTSGKVYATFGDGIAVVQDNVAGIPTYTIEGRILDSNGLPVSSTNIFIDLDSVAGTDQDGYYRISDLPAGTYNIRPSSQEYTFSPSSYNVTIPGVLTGYDFVATPIPGIKVEYIALGDSVAAGHGLSDNAKDSPDYPCRRSHDKSYPAQLKAMLEARGYRVTEFVHLACSGATTQEPDWTELEQNGQSHQHKWFRFQAEDAITFLRSSRHIPGRPVLVTITIGANDFPWTDPEGLCWLLNIDNDKTFKAKVATITTNVAKEVRDQVQELLKFPEVTVVVTGYPNPFNSKSWIFSALRQEIKCLGSFLKNDAEYYKRTDYAVQLLNGSLDGEVVRAFRQRNRIKFAGGIYREFRNHEALGRECGNTNTPVKDPTDVRNYTWIQHPSDQESYSWPGAQMSQVAKYSTVPDYNNWRGDCFHPNYTGASRIASNADSTLILFGK
jgi:lysophospholipase L1-like esterase